LSKEVNGVESFSELVDGKKVTLTRKLMGCMGKWVLQQLHDFE
jgi:hypothetical protein